MIKKQSFRKLEISTKQEKENYRETAAYLEYRATAVCVHLRRTTQGSAQEKFFINLASQLTKTKLYFPSQAGKHNLNFGRPPLNHYTYCLGTDFLTAIWFAMFENFVKIELLRMYCLPIFHAWFEPSILFEILSRLFNLGE